MCWNAEVSLQSFLIGFTAIFIANQKGLSLPITIFCLTIVFMQLIEYFVWTYYDNPTVNFTASLAAAGLLWLQPIASMLTLESNQMIPFIQAYVGLSFLAFLLPRKIPYEERYTMKRAENGHLQWNWLQKDVQTTISLVLYFIFLLTPLLLRKQYTLLSITLMTLAISLFTFYKDNTWGSMWCWIINYLVIGICGYQVLLSKS
jgi:hypothetical protein